MCELYGHLSRETADIYGLVLTASGIRYRVKRQNDRWSIRVDETAIDTALECIEKYRAENPVREVPPERCPPRIFGAIWVSLMLLASFAAAGSGEDFQRIAGLCGVSAAGIRNGEVYRAATALMLHASPAHLAGNIAAVAVFGTAVCHVTGSGAGWLMILLSGILGNLANAALIGSGHLSIGASTAVFGAVGLLTAYQFDQKIRSPERRTRAWLPLAGGLALLGFLGAGAHTDLTAHLFGFAAGTLLGFGYVRFLKQPVNKKIQAACMTAAIGLLAASWLWAYFAE